MHPAEVSIPAGGTAVLEVQWQCPFSNEAESSGFSRTAILAITDAESGEHKRVRLFCPPTTRHTQKDMAPSVATDRAAVPPGRPPLHPHDNLVVPVSPIRWELPEVVDWGVCQVARHYTAVLRVRTSDISRGTVSSRSRSQNVTPITIACSFRLDTHSDLMVREHRESLL